MNKIYKFDVQTKEFVQELEINEQYGLSLPFITTVKPLSKKEGFAIFFNGTKWEYVEDNRGTIVYNKETKEESKIDYLGKIKDDVTTLQPEKFDIWDYDLNKWVCDEKTKEEYRINSINNKTEQIITTPYPIYKQLNIDNLLNPYTIEMRENKNMFIETVRNIGRMAKEDGTQLEDINWAGLDEITEPYQITQDLILKARTLLGE